MIKRIVVVLVAIALLGAPAARADVGDERDGCRYDATECGVPVLLPFNGRIFSTFVPVLDTPEARAGYAAMLPAGFSMPAGDPGFWVSFTDAHLGTAIPVVDATVPKLLAALGQAPGGNAWREVGIQMRVSYTTAEGVTQDGSYEVSFATDGLIGYLGRPSYPKFYADVVYEATPVSVGPLALPGSSWHAVASVAGPTTDGESVPVQEATFTPADIPLPAYTEERRPDWRLAPNDVDGGGTHQGPDVIQLDTEYQGLVPVPFVIGRDLGPVEIPGVTASPQLQPGLVHVTLDPRFARYDEQSPEPIPDEVWAGIDLGTIIDLDSTQPGWLIEGQFFLQALQDEVVGRGGCASVGTCNERLQNQPHDAPPAEQNPPWGGLGRGVSCQTVVGTTCEFTTSNPNGAYAGGFISSSTGSYEVRNVTPGCRIWSFARIASGSNGLVYREGGDDVFRASGAGTGNLAFDDQCTYRLTVNADGVGAVYAGQVN